MVAKRDYSNGRLPSIDKAHRGEYARN